MTEQPHNPVEDSFISKSPEEVLEMIAHELPQIAAFFNIGLSLMDRQIRAGQSEKVVQRIENLHRINETLMHLSDSTRRYIEQRRNG
jgi:hypothetical protein